MTEALVVLSGGQDSTTCLFWAKRKFDRVHAITFDYGQHHRLEISAAKHVAAMASVASHEIIEVPGVLKSSSPLLNKGRDLERYENYEQMDGVIQDRVELTFVPMRNTFFLTVALNHALSLGVYDLVTGICQEDNANYPDCTEDFRASFQAMANISLGVDNHHIAPKVAIHAPLMYLSKADTVRLSRSLPGCWEALAYTHTSYDGSYPPVDMNHANVLRAQGFLEAGFPDPLVIRAWMENLMDLPDTSNYDSLR